ncbi:MAG: hypothetical protein LBC50_02620 [Candidatus Ancillula sp.]|jgi:hypothetical protein|nr:hypothetical protein [Candidatus Ancillula sp.]
MLQIVLSIISCGIGVYAYGNNACAIFTGKMQTSFWGRLIWLGTNTVVLLALFGGNASMLTIIPMIFNVSFMVLIQIACAYRRLFTITKIDIVCLVIVAVGMAYYVFASEIGGLVITLVADAIGGALVILGMFKRLHTGGKPENRRQYVLSGVRNVMMLFANDSAPTFLSVFGLAFQTFEALVLAICAHITKKSSLAKQGDDTSA